MNNIKKEILQNILNKYNKGKLNDLRFITLMVECLNNYK